jgi:hypothetical protein
MKQEDKELLLKDISARLPYGVKCIVTKSRTEEGQKGDVGEIVCVCLEGVDCIDTSNFFSEFGNFKPYLFPLSSISEEQKKYISDRWGVNEEFDFEIDPNWGEYFVELSDAVDFINWCYENHFDINFLILKGLALDATGKNIY